MAIIIHGQTTSSAKGKCKVVFEHLGQRRRIEADTIVSALGLKSDGTLAGELPGWEGKAVVVGDASIPRKALEAARMGFVAGTGVALQ
jgi:hypothetical protein